MEKDRNQRGIESRGIQQRKVGVRGVNDNRSSGHRNYISGAPLQRLEANAKEENALQREPTNVPTSSVVQREKPKMETANGKFIYIADYYTNPSYKGRVPFSYETIKFVEYRGGEIRSAGFSGCFMMAFHFNGEGIDRGFVNTIQSTGAAPDLSVTKQYIAHVDNKIRTAVLDAKNRGLITIEALFRPSTKGTKRRKEEYFSKYPWRKRLGFHFTRYPMPYSGLKDFTGGMTYSGTAGWKGAVYLQERIPLSGEQDRINYKWENKLFESYDAVQMGSHGHRSMAYICASALTDSSITEEDKTAALGVLGSLPRNAIEETLEEIIEDGETTIRDKLTEELRRRN